MFSDESNFKLWSRNQFMWVRRLRGSNRFESKFTMKTIKHPAKVMVWGCLSFKGPGNLSVLAKSTTMNQHLYLDVLKKKLEPVMQ